MAEIGFEGLTELMLDLEDVANIPQDVQDEMLSAQADVVAAAQKEKARAYGVADTGLLISSIKKGRPKTKKGVRVIYVTASGSRRRGKTTVRNAEIAFLNEYGTKHQRARPFIRDANEASAEAATAAAMQVYDKYLQSKNL